ncbi:dUTP diphosphatase [Hydrogenovibrio sp. JE_KL2]|uniref:dUTP diphosphatase n=1 Tax=Hydrogenovibrio sp. JE_KL2 TaxID=2651188 RepID=UPI00128E08D6|nr:dUTP diphosphatase [Hydrogenovibrio sp. JE_KL2]MPQ76153.1 dUTPase [Hydrogenovibrio sp. JE_KL2]
MNKLNEINEMLSMQAALNEMTNGADWRSGKTALGKVIDWRRCIVMETAELIDSYPWKHWKSVDATTDMENVRVELVDIWHFLLSLALENFSKDEAADILNKAYESSDDEKLKDLSVIIQVQVHEAMMAKALIKTQVTDSYLSALAVTFFRSCQVAELEFEQLYQIYMAKNVLNKFRQDHGYKEGTYIKVWNGKEDNVVMFEIIERMTTFSGDELYISLKESYSQLA